MKKPTRILALLAFGAFSGIAFAQEEMDLKVVAHNDEGEAVAEALVTLDSKLRFTETGVGVFKGETMTVGFNYADVTSLSFRYDVRSAAGVVVSPIGLGLRDNPVGESLEIIGMTENSASLTVTDLKGRVRVSLPEWKGETVNVGELTPGLYFVTINQTTLKFIKK